MSYRPSLVASIVIIACAIPLPAQTENGTENDPAFLAKFEKTFEIGGAVYAKDFVPAGLMSGPLHTVAEGAYNDGLRNTYLVIAGNEQYEVTGTPALVQFLRELYAIDYLRGVSKSEEFGKAFANAGKQKVGSAVGLVTHPFSTLKNVPKGASRFFGRIGEGLKGGKSETEDSGLKGLTGVSEAKAKLAVQLGVSPYTTNETLQQELTKVARASAGGGLILNAATAAVGGGAGTVLSAVGMNETLQEALVSSTPEDLRIANRKKLLALSASRAVTEEFLMHPWFSPWHETITADALFRIGVNPTAFLTNAVMSMTVEDAFFFQRLAQILARYHSTVMPLRTIRFEHKAITAIDRNGTLVVPVSLDYAIWCERTARRTEEFAALAKTGGTIKGLALWTDGRLSERLKEEFKARNITWREHALDAGSR
jgi:hypothetical protein